MDPVTPIQLVFPFLLTETWITKNSYCWYCFTLVIIWFTLVNVFHRITRIVICNYVKGEGSRLWIIIFNYFSPYRLKIMSINKQMNKWAAYILNYHLVVNYSHLNFCGSTKTFFGSYLISEACSSSWQITNVLTISILLSISVIITLRIFQLTKLSQELRYDLYFHSSIQKMMLKFYIKEIWEVKVEEKQS